MNWFQGLWGGISNTLGHGANYLSTKYGMESGLTLKQMEDLEKADIRKKEQQRKYFVYFLIFVAIIAVVIILIKLK